MSEATAGLFSPHIAALMRATRPDITRFGYMSDAEKASKVLDTLKGAEREPPQVALPMLNSLISLAQGEGAQPLEVEEARASAFMAICELGKALHRGQPADRLWQPAISATERWKALA